MATGVKVFSFLVTVLAFSDFLTTNAIYTDSEVVRYAIHNTGDADIVISEHSRQKRDASNSTSTTATMPTTAPPTIVTGGTGDKIVEDNHDYYQAEYIEDGTSLWVDISGAEGVITHDTLSSSHRTAVKISLPFQFPFYGHYQETVTIATGGFLYMSDFVHQWLTATQYIAPLMANFDTTLGNFSNIHYLKNQHYFVAQWDNVYLNDQPEAGAFTFQAQLKQGGGIIFVYKTIPTEISAINHNEHPVKLGTSDAYYIDSYDPLIGKYRRTIYEYHRVSLNTTRIHSGFAIKISPLVTCNALSSCEKCLSTVIPSFSCGWCHTLQRCSDAFDRGRQEWINSECQAEADMQNCSYIPPPKTTTTMSGPNVNGQKKPRGDSGAVVGIVFAVIILVLIIACFAGWVVYAYRNPESRSGQWLIRNRPGELAQKIKFWKKSNQESGEKYAVSVDANTTTA